MNKQKVLLKLRRMLLDNKYKSGNSDTAIKFLFNERLPPEDILYYFKNLISLSVISRRISKNAISHSHKNIYCENIEHYGSFEFELITTAILCQKYKNEIADFLRLKQEYSTAWFKSNFEQASEILDKIEKRLGISFWLIEARISLIQEKDGLEAQKRYIAKIISEDGMEVGSTSYYLAFMLSARVEAGLSWDSYNEMLKKSLKDIPKDDPFYSYLMYKLVPTSFIKPSQAYAILLCEKSSTIIDRYNTLVTVSQVLSLNQDQNESYRKVMEMLYKSSGGKYLAIRKNINLNESGGKDVIIEIFEDYAKEEYENAANKLENLFKEKPFLVEIYHLAVLVEEKTRAILPKNKVSILAKELALCKKDFHVIQQDIFKISSVLYHTGVTWHVMQLFNYFTANENNYYTSEIGQLSALNANCTIPLDLTLISMGVSSIYASGYIDRYSHYASVRLMAKIYDGSLTEVTKFSDLGFAESFLNSCFAVNTMMKGHDSDAIGQFKNIIDNFVLREDSTVEYLLYITYYVQCLLKVDLILNAMEFIVENYLWKVNCVCRFQINDILNCIETNYEKINHNLSVPIFYDIYSKKISKSKDIEKYEACEDFLSHHSTYKPSELKEYLGILDKSKLIYFLHAMCTTEMLSATGRYILLTNVQNERIATCQLLSEIDNENSVRYIAEIKNITKDQLIAQGIKAVDESKIYVNIDGIKGTLKNVKEGFERLKELFRMSFYNDVLKKIGMVNQLKSRFIMFGGGMEECQQLLKRLFVEIRDEFVASNKHGLDGYLGVGIRHGAFLNKLRTPFQDASLITKRDKDTGVYKEATFWREIFSELPDETVSSLILRLQQFSQEVDSEISYIQDVLFRVKTENQNPEGLFDFGINMVNLTLLLTEINEELTYDMFLDRIFEILWHMTKKSLDGIRNHIEINIKNKFFNLFKDLSTDTYNLLGKSSASVIEYKIVNLRTRVMNELDAVANWFQLSQIVSHPPYEISLPLDIGIAIARNLSVKETMRVRIVKNDTVTMKGESLKFFVEILNILLDNVVKYNGFEDGNVPDVLIEFSRDDNKIFLKVQNSLAQAIITEKKLAEIEQKQLELQMPVKLEAVSGTGGTGFEKIKKMIKYDLLTSGYLAVGIDSDQFTFSMQIDVKDISL